MAMEVLLKIKAAEEKAEELRKTAAAAAKDALKIAAKENAQIEDKTLTQARRESLKKVDDARLAARAELDAQQAERLEACERLKTAARKKLDAAADICLARLLK